LPCTIKNFTRTLRLQYSFILLGGIAANIKATTTRLKVPANTGAFFRNFTARAAEQLPRNLRTRTALIFQSGDGVVTSVRTISN
jgi:hypothetical protein